MVEDQELNYFKAVRENNLSAVRKLLYDNAELVNKRMLGDATLLNNQIWKNKKIIAIPNSDKRSSPALHFAVFHGNHEMVKILLEFGADVNSFGYENNHEMTPAIILATWEGGIEVLRLLLDHNADPNIRSSNGVSAIATTIKHDQIDRVNLLKSYGATT